MSNAFGGDRVLCRAVRRVRLRVDCRPVDDGGCDVPSVRTESSGGDVRVRERTTCVWCVRCGAAVKSAVVVTPATGCARIKCNSLSASAAHRARARILCRTHYAVVRRPARTLSPAHTRQPPSPAAAAPNRGTLFRSPRPADRLLAAAAAVRTHSHSLALSLSVLRPFSLALSFFRSVSLFFSLFFYRKKSKRVGPSAALRAPHATLTHFFPHRRRVIFGNGSSRRGIPPSTGNRPWSYSAHDRIPPRSTDPVISSVRATAAMPTDGVPEVAHPVHFAETIHFVNLQHKVQLYFWGW